MSEFELIAKIRAASPTHERVILGIGDDCASLRVRPDHELLVTTDMLMDGRHFILGEATPEQIGRKTMGVNLSDIAAMGGTPIGAVVAVALPKGKAMTDLADGLQRGIDEMARRFDVSLVGGDTNAWNGPLVVSITLFGEVEFGRAVRRSGAKVGDAIFVTGPLGGSLLGRHLEVEPRITQGRSLATILNVHSMIDISDGLASDLSHILEESGGLGAILDADRVPIHSDAVRLAELDGKSPLEHALNDGEDFELIFTTSGNEIPRLEALVPGARVIGEITREPGIRLREHGGRTTSITAQGFDHFLK